MIPPMSPEPEGQEFSPGATLAERGGKAIGPSTKPVATLTKAHVSRHYEPSLALGVSLAKPSEFHLVLSLISEEPWQDISLFVPPTPGQQFLPCCPSGLLVSATAALRRPGHTRRPSGSSGPSLS